MNDNSIQNNIVTIQIPDSATELAQEVYDDVAKPVASETGKLLGIIPRAIRAALAPLEKWILNSEYNIAETTKLLDEKLANVAPEKITSPEAYVAVPALQALAYSMNSNDLRELYANLLAKSMNTDTKDFVHPCFAESIKQMSPIDAKVASILLDSENKPIVDLQKEYPDSKGFDLLETNITGLSIAEHSLLASSIDNLLKLKFIDIPADESYVDKKWYEIITHSREYQKLFAKHNATVVSEKIVPKERIIRRTALGELFYKICIQ